MIQAFSEFNIIEPNFVYIIEIKILNSLHVLFPLIKRLKFRNNQPIYCSKKSIV